MITPFSVVPSRQRPSVFSSDMDQFLSEMGRFVNEANVLEQSLQLTATSGTSVSTLTVVTGTVDIQTQSGKAWVPGSFVYVVGAASVSNFMHGQVVAYYAASGVLRVNIVSVAGAGTFSNWVIGLAAPVPQSQTFSGDLFADVVGVESNFRMWMAGTHPVISFGPSTTIEFNRESSYFVYSHAGQSWFWISPEDGPSRLGVANTNNGLVCKYQMDMAISGAIDIFNPIGEIKAIVNLNAPPGMLLIDGRTIGSAGSGATSRANGDTYDLFVQMWSFPGIPMQDSSGASVSRGVSADADWSANRRLKLFTPDGGAFLRMWAPGQTVDSGRVAGSSQAPFAGSFSVSADQDDGDSSGGSFRSVTNIRFNGAQIIGNGAGSGTVTVDPGDARPYNLAVPHYIRYKN